MNDDDPIICYYALQIVACTPNSEYTDDFMRVFTFLEHSNQKIRQLVMFLISNLSSSRIQEAYEHSINKKSFNSPHEKGLYSLINFNNLTSPEVGAMINNDDAIIRKYGIIVARKLYDKYPEIINKSVNHQDLDIQVFSKDEVRAKTKSAKRFRNNKKS